MQLRATRLTAIASAVKRAIKAFSPAQLFGTGAPGVWYDPSDIKLDWRYNLLTYTEQFDNAVWFKSGVSVSANTQETADPIGGNTADKLLETSTTTAHYIDTASAISVVSGSVYTRSISIKYLGRQWVVLDMYDTASRYTYFDLQNGVVGTNAAGTTATIVSQGNGWYRCTISRTVIAATIYNATLTSQSDGGSISFAGDSTKGIYIWGASLTTAAKASLPYQQIVTPEISYLNYQPQPILYQDSAGTTPVTAVEQPVRLMLDKSQGLVLGPKIVDDNFNSGTSGWISYTNAAETSAVSTANGNLVVTTQRSDGSSGAKKPLTGLTAGKWYKATAQIKKTTDPSANLATANLRFVNGDATVGWVASFPTTSTSFVAATIYFSPTGTTGTLGLVSGGTAATTSTYVMEYDDVVVQELAGNHAFQATNGSEPRLSARVNKLLATATLATQSVTTRAAAHTLRFEGAGSITLSGTATGTFAAGSHSVTATAGTLTLTVSGSVTSADLRETNDGVGVPTYQAVVTSTNYATTGFLPYLKFDGVDDSLSTNSINFTSTDKMSVFAGVRKLSDAAQGMVAEIGNDANNAFLLLAPRTNAGLNYGFRSKGTTASDATSSSSYTSPITNTLTGLGDISGDLATLRVNGVQAAQNTGDQGTGNFGNYPLYIGRRAGSSLPFNGQMYSMIIVGKAVTAGELSGTETYVNQKTGAY